MNNIPLHPMVVHFPIVLSFLLPLFAIGALWIANRRGSAANRTWAIPAVLALALAVSAFVATRTGENEEERVEDVVSENVLHQHEEAAERFLAIAGVVAGIALLGLVRGTAGSAARLVATAGSLVIVLAGFQVGKAGGELVYEHNAGAAYMQSGNQAGETPSERGKDEQDSDAR
jgi:uncharacterized membrane protein